MLSSFAKAQIDQVGSVTLLPGTDIAFSSIPDDFGFGDVFTPATGQTPIYKTLDPGNSSEVIEITDVDVSRGFSVTMSITNFVSGENIIPYSNIGFVTLSESLTEVVDGDPANNPPGAPNLVALQDCNWDPSSGKTMAEYCDDDLGLFINFTGPVPANSSLAADAGPSDTTINLIDGTAFQNGPAAIIINGDIINYTAKAGNQLIGVTSIDSSHTTGDNVEQFIFNSTEELLFENSTDGDTGVYSTGFGFRMLVDSGLNQGTYSSTLTFTLIPS